MLHSFRVRLGRFACVLAAAGAALTLAATQALAAGTWTIVTAPPSGQNASLSGVATVSTTATWAVGHDGVSGSLNPLVLRTP
jgi:hypothetical protein